MVTDITSCSAQCGGFVSGRGGADVTSRGVCWSTVPNPTVNDSHTADATGNGGFKSVLSGLTPGTTYYIRAYATNSVGTAYGEEQSFTATHPVADSVLIDAQTCPGANTMMDIDGNVYKTVQIGLQCWMKENLRTTRYADGTVIPIGYIRYHDVAHRYSPFGMESLASRYGWLYNWPAVMHGDSTSNTNPSGVQGICPNGWHVPSMEEWQQLRQYLRSDSRYWCEGDSMVRIMKEWMCGTRPLLQSILARRSPWASLSAVSAISVRPSATRTPRCSPPPTLHKQGIVVCDDLFPSGLALGIASYKVVHHSLPMPFADIIIVLEKIGVCIFRQLVNGRHPARLRRPVPGPKGPEKRVHRLLNTLSDLCRDLPVDIII